MASSTTQATVSRSDKLGTYVQLRAGASEVSDFVPGGIIFNGSSVQVLFEQGVFCKVQYVDASKTLVGFVKKQHLDFKNPAIQARMPSPPAVQQPPVGGGGGGACCASALCAAGTVLICAMTSLLASFAPRTSGPLLLASEDVSAGDDDDPPESAREA